MASAILSVDQVTKQYNKNEVVLNKVSLDIELGTFTVIIGPSGSGKSTLLNIMSGLLKPTKGRVFYKNMDITRFGEMELAKFRRDDVGQVFQNDYLLSQLTVEENMRIAISVEGEHYSIEELANLLDLENILHQYPGELSSGQKQRVAIARAIINKPSILFCDEATGALDETNSKRVISLLHHIQQNYGVTIIFITHNQDIAHTASRIITVKNGEVFNDLHNSNWIKAGL